MWTPLAISRYRPIGFMFSATTAYILPARPGELIVAHRPSMGIHLLRNKRNSSSSPSSLAVLSWSPWQPGESPACASSFCSPLKQCALAILPTDWLLQGVEPPRYRTPHLARLTVVLTARALSRLTHQLIGFAAQRRSHRPARSLSFAVPVYQKPSNGPPQPPNLLLK